MNLLPNDAEIALYVEGDVLRAIRNYRVRCKATVREAVIAFQWVGFPTGRYQRVACR